MNRLSRLRTLAAGTVLACLVGSAVATTAGAAGRTLTLGQTRLSGWIEGKVVVTVDADGTERLSARLPHPALPLLSPDGRWVAFTTNKGTFTMRRDGSGYRELVTGIGSRVMAWSPDSRSLLVQSPHLVAEIVHIVDGATRALLPGGDWAGLSATFTPDSRYVLAAFSHGWQLIRTSDGTTRRFVKAPCSAAADLGFSPDGKRISFVCNAYGALPWTGILTIATGKVTRVGDWQDSSPVWVSSSTLATLHAATASAPQQVRTYGLGGHLVASVNLAVRVLQLYATRPPLVGGTGQPITG